MRWLLLFLFLLVIPVQAQPGHFVHRRGRHILDGRGHKIQLRGVNLGGWLLWEGWIFGQGALISENRIDEGLSKLVGATAADRFRQDVYQNFVREQDLKAIASAGFNVVRVPINYRLLQTSAGWQVLDHLLGWCDRYHVFAVLDLHAAPGGQSRVFTCDPPGKGTLWGNTSSQGDTIRLWRQIAARYGSRDIVAGYDLLNEPTAPGGDQLNALYRRIIKSIREVDSHHMIILEGNKLGSDPKTLQRLDENQALSPHIYTWFGDDRRAHLKEWQDAAQRCECPQWVGEFGENTLAIIDSTIAMYEEPGYHISGWCFWTWKRAPGKFPGLLVFTEPRDWAAVMVWIKHPLIHRRPQPEQARRGMADFLASLQSVRAGSPMLDVLRRHLTRR